MLLALFGQAKLARTERELDFAKRILTRIYVEKSGERDLENVVEAAKATLDLVQQKLESQADQIDGAPPANPISGETEPRQLVADPSMETEGPRPQPDALSSPQLDADHQP